MNANARTPLTAYQRDVWAANSNFPENPQFNCQIYDSFQGSVDLGVLAGCLRRAAEAGDAFRLRFGEVEGVPHQWLADAPEVRTVDLSAEPDPAAAARRWIRDSFDRPFDLRGGRTSELTLLVESGSVVHAHVKAHHIVADAWGLNLFMTRVRADYDHVLRTGSPLTAEAPQYADFVRAEADYRASPEHRADRDFFRASMAGVVPEFFPRKEASGARRSARHSFVIERSLVNRIRERGDSVFAFVSAAFSVYLSRVLRTEEVVLGVPLLNRPTDEQRRTVGHFANTLPLVVRPSGGRTMGELVAEVRGATRALKPHERVALGDVLRDVAPPSSDGPRRLFDVTVAHLRWPRQLEIPGLSYGTVVQARAHDTDALAVVVNELDDVGDVLVDVDHGCDIFDEDFPVEAVGRHLKAVIERTLDAPDRPLAEISMLGADERTALVDGGNDTAEEYAADRTLHGLFEEQAARTPDRTAVVDDATGQSFTFAGLDERADRIARVLRERGVRPGDRVAVLMERGLSVPAAVLGVLKSGGAYTPVAPDYPAERIRFLIEDSGAKAVLVAGGGAGGVVVGGEVPVLDVEDLPQVSGAPLEPAAGPRDPAYVIYTSGSTGRPKGVVVEHRSVINRLAWMQRRYPVGEGDVLLQKTPISFDVSVWELFWWAVEGASLALLPPGGEKDPREVLRTIARRRVGVVHFVPSMFAAFLDLLEESPGLVDDARSLHHVFCSGEALPPVLVDRFNRLFAGEAAPRLVNLYGPTEATVDVTSFDCPGDPARPVGRVPIGRPIDNTRLYVLDPDGGPQPVGAPGELCVAGVGVARGRPVYALQAAGTHPGVEPSDSIPEIAARYLEAVRRARPDGPYVIGGWSFGGFIAFEMARQLRLTHPEDVASLILIDPIAVAPGERPSVADSSLLEWFFWELLWMERGGETPLEAIPEGLDADGTFDFVVERATAAGILPAEGSQTSVRRLFAMFKAHWHALLTYRPEQAHEDLVLLRATAPLPKVLEPMHGAAHSLHEDPSNGWRELTTGRVEVVEVPGDHLVLLEEPHVAAVAEHVARAAENGFR